MYVTAGVTYKCQPTVHVLFYRSQGKLLGEKQTKTCPACMAIQYWYLYMTFLH